MRTIQFKTKYEDLITRLPGLFAYVEMDEYGNSMLHKATDSPMGCYGKIVENLKVNCSVDGVIKSDETYPFKYLLKLYYEHKDEQEYEGLVNFIEKGIGKINVVLKGIDLKECDLVPSVIYLANIHTLYEEMTYLKRVSELYEEHIQTKDKNIDNESENRLCCKHREYERKGGEEMLNFLEEHLTDAEKIASEYYYYSLNRDKSLNINYNINLYSSERDLGIVTPLGDRQVNNETKEINLNYKSESKLNSLRRYKSYVDV